MAELNDKNVAQLLQQLYQMAMQGGQQAAQTGAQLGYDSGNVPQMMGARATQVKPLSSPSGEGAKAGFDVGSLSPLKQAQWKALEKGAKAQVEEALVAGVPAEHIEQQLLGGMPTAQPPVTEEQKQQALASLLGGQNMQSGVETQQSQQIQQQVTPDSLNMGGGILSKLMSMIGIEESPEATLQRLQAQKIQQELQGNVPLQKGEREKIELTADLESINKQIGSELEKPLSADAAKTLANAKLGIDLIGVLNTAFDKNDNIFKAIWTAGNPQAQEVRTSVKQLSDILGRLRSGGAINDDELKTFSELVPLVGLKGKLETKENVKFKLQILGQLMTDVRNGISTPQERSKTARFVSNAINEGYSPSEINKFLRGQKNAKISK